MFGNSGMVEEFHTKPLAYVDKIFQSNLNDDKSWPKAVETFFEEKAEKLHNELDLVSINETPNHLLMDGQIVKFRCMIQDMFDPEYFMDKYVVKNVTNGSNRFATCRYRDTTDLGPEEEALDEPGNTKHGERLSYYCISIPGEAPWVKDAYKSQEPKICHPSTSMRSSESSIKRVRDDEEDMNDQMETNKQQQTAAIPDFLGSKDQSVTDEVPMNNEPQKIPENEAMDTGDVKKTKSDDDKPATSNKPTSNISPLNFPIAKAKGQAAIVKLYNVEDGTFKVNDMVEFIGIVSLSPLLANTHSDMDDNDILAQFSKQEIVAKNPPASLIPRLHVVKYTKLCHNNPQLPRELTGNNVAWEELRRSRDDLHSLFTQLLLGDVIAADYLLAHLMSKIYKRSDGLCLGKFSMNIFSLPSSKNFTKRLSTILQLIMSKSHYFPLTIESLNSLTFVPKKDYASNRLTSGLLQLSSGTYLVLDETVMKDGQLNSQGITNLTSLGQMIKQQSVEYDFGFHKIAFESDIPCLVFSEGRSMLPQDVQIMLKPQGEVNEETINAIFVNVGKSLEVEVLSRLRNYVTLAKSSAFDISEEAMNFVQTDFVHERQKENSQLKTADDLHTLLVLARLLALSRGEKSINANIWNEAKNMENERKQRSAHLPSRIQPNM